MSLTPCMGGWCAKRQHCANYHAANEARQPEERLCTPGQDGAGIEHRIVLHKPAGTWERGSFDGLLRGPSPMEWLA